MCDTKYIATCAGPAPGAASNLQTLAKTLAPLHNPPVMMHATHGPELVADHNAGYDALVTARVLLRLLTAFQTFRAGAADADAAKLSMVEFVNHMGRYTGTDRPDGRFCLPAWDDDAVWAHFKNRLRVNGTEEGLLVLEDAGGVMLAEAGAPVSAVENPLGKDW